MNDNEIEKMILELQKKDCDEFELKKIRTRRNVMLRVGDVFALQPLDGQYLFGKILEVGTDSYQIGRMEDTAVVFIFDGLCNSLDDYATYINYSNILVGPQIVEKGYWTRGWFYTLGNMGTTREEEDLEYCFYWKSRNCYCNAAGQVISKPIGLISNFGVNTRIGISYSVKEAWIRKGNLGWMK